MTKKPQTSKEAVEKVVKNICRKARQTYSAEEKIRIILAGLRGEESISVLCRREGIAESLYYSWSKVTEPLIPQLMRLDCRLRMPAASNSTVAIHRAC